MKRKAQAAFEFLTTYGWAFLVIAGVLGVMAYFGFTDFTNQIPSQCTFDKAFNCEAGLVLNDGSFGIEMTSQESRAVNITKVLCVFPQSEEGLLLKFSGVIVERGANVTFVCDYKGFGDSESLDLEKKDKFQMKIMYSYANDPGALPAVATADLIQEVSKEREIFDNYYLDAAPSWLNREPWDLTS